MKSKLNKVRQLLVNLNQEELKALQAEIEEILPAARKPTPEEALLAPGHYFEERTVTTGTSTLHYLYERCYEREGRKLKHKGKMLYKGSKAEYVREMLSDVLVL